jgi:phosphoribosylformylglycinamidine synthase
VHVVSGTASGSAEAALRAQMQTPAFPVDLAEVPTRDDTPAAEHLFGETPGRIVFEFDEKHSDAVHDAGFTIIGETTDDGQLVIANGDDPLINVAISELKPIWKQGLVEFY